MNLTPMKSLDIVILASNIFPLNSPRSFRATELAKELSRQGHQVTLYALLGDYDYSQFCVETGIKVKGYTKSNWGNKNSDDQLELNFIKRVLIKLFKNILDYPRLEYMFKVKKALKAEHDFDYLISIAHPFTIHWGVLYYLRNNKRNFRVWTSDCGDPFMSNLFVKYPFYFKYLEKNWCRRTDYITIPVKESKSGYFEECQDKLKVIPQGFDFSNVELSDYKKNKVPAFAYAGNAYKELRDPTLFLEYLSSVDYDFKFIVYTKTKLFFEPFKNKLGDKMEIKDFIPRQNLLKELSTMDFLVNIVNETSLQQPSKLIDYALTKRPILEISTGFNEQINFDDFINEDYSNQFVLENQENYDIKNVAKEFLSLYHEKTNKL